MNNFNDIYEKLYEQYSSQIDQKKENEKKLLIISLLFYIFIIFILFISSCGVFFPLFTILYIITLIFIFSTSTYKKQFKNTIIKSLVSFYNENLNYSAKDKISSYDYIDAGFEKFDDIHSEDHIFGTLDNLGRLDCYDLYTESIYTDENGVSHRNTIFTGFFSMLQLNFNTNATIKIHSDKGFLGNSLSKNKMQVSMDSQEFEKVFNVYSTDKIKAMQILTSDVMELMIDFKNKYNFKYEITIKNNMIYIRIHCKDLFETNLFKSSLDFDTLYEYFNIIDFTCNLNTALVKSIENSQIN